MSSEDTKVSLADGMLSIHTKGASLAAILDAVAKDGGMKLSGLQPGGETDQRIYGDYGPGQPREVLTELLNGSGYNVIMMGRTLAGTPSELALSPRAPGGVPNPPPQSFANQNNGYRSDYVEQPTTYPPPQNNSQPPTPNPSGRVRTPQQILQELERMRQGQQTQQQQ